MLRLSRLFYVLSLATFALSFAFFGANDDVRSTACFALCVALFTLARQEEEYEYDDEADEEG